MNIPLNIDWQQIFLHLFNFAILAGGLYLLLYKPVKKFMEQREEYYRGLEEAAKSQMCQAECLKRDYEKRIREADAEIVEKRNKSLLLMEEMNRQKVQEAETSAERVIDNAKQEAERERAKILDETQKEIADMVTMAAEKLLLQATAAEAFNQFLTLAERGEKRE